MRLPLMILSKNYNRRYLNSNLVKTTTTTEKKTTTTTTFIHHQQLPCHFSNSSCSSSSIRHNSTGTNVNPAMIMRSKKHANDGSFSLDTTTTTHDDTPTAITTSSDTGTDTDTDTNTGGSEAKIRFSKLLSQYSTNLGVSRRGIERYIHNGEVTIAGKVVRSPQLSIPLEIFQSWCRTNNNNVVKVARKSVSFPTNYSSLSMKQLEKQLLLADTTTTTDKAMLADTSTKNNAKLWIVHKVKGEVVAEHDPQNRPCLIDRLLRSGVGRSGKKKRKKHLQTSYHLKPIGRLDMNTEGLILITTCGKYAREMELPTNQLHRTYRVRVHGILSQYKLKTIAKGISIDGIKYHKMKVKTDDSNTRAGKGTNRWLTITCTQGKNRQIRNVLSHLGLTVTRLIRTSYGDYQLQTIPPGMALEVPVKSIQKQKHKGALFRQRRRREENKEDNKQEMKPPPVQWIQH